MKNFENLKKLNNLWFVFVAIALFACERDLSLQEANKDFTDQNSRPRPYFIKVPQGFPQMPLPPDNPLTVEGVELGRMLFYDPILSKDNKQSCGGCHFQSNGFADPNRFSVGVDGIAGDRNAMALINLGWDRHFFWDGRSATMEIQALEPVPNPIEMHLSWVEAMDKLNQHPDYPALFKHVFGVDVIDSLLVAKAIAQFERTLISGNSKYDKVRRGQALLTEIERLGESIFFSEKGDCFHCHNYPFFNSPEFHNNGLQQTIVDSGRFLVTKRTDDLGKFKAPTLRNIALTAPYMHDGRFTTLKQVVEFYNNSVNQTSPNVDPMMQKPNRFNGSLRLSSAEVDAVVAFLETLTDEDFITNPAFSNPN